MDTYAMVNISFGAFEALQTWKVHLHKLHQLRRSQGESWILGIWMLLTTRLYLPENIGQEVNSCKRSEETLRGHHSARMFGHAVLRCFHEANSERDNMRPER